MPTINPIEQYERDITAASRYGPPTKAAKEQAARNFGRNVANEIFGRYIADALT